VHVYFIGKHYLGPMCHRALLRPEWGITLAANERRISAGN